MSRCLAYLAVGLGGGVAAHRECAARDVDVVDARPVRALRGAGAQLGRGRAVAHLAGEAVGVELAALGGATTGSSGGGDYGEGDSKQTAER